MTENDTTGTTEEPGSTESASAPSAPAGRPRRRRAAAGRDTGPPPVFEPVTADAAPVEPATDAVVEELPAAVEPVIEELPAEPTVEVPAAQAATAEPVATTAEAAAATAEPVARRRRRPRATVTFGVGHEVGEDGEPHDAPVIDPSIAPTTTPPPGVAGGSPFALAFQPAPVDPLSEALEEEVADDLAEDLAAGLTDEESDEASALVSDDVEIDESDDRPRRRRRGRRGRGRARLDDEGEETAEGDDSAEGDSGEAGAESEADSGDGDDESDDAEDNADGTPGTGSRRRRRRRRSGTGGGDAASDDDPPNTVIHVRTPREGGGGGGGNNRNRGGGNRDGGRDGGGREDSDGVRGVQGSTRLEAKRQRRRDGRGEQRRRPPVLTEAEFLARRESVERKMVVRRTGERTQIAVLEDGVLVEHYVTKSSATSYAGNIYLGKVQNVLASMEAAFVDIGKGRNAVLYAGEVSVDPEVGKPQRIEQALKSGQTVLVQVTKDPVGHKGARLTSQLSLPGRYLVYVPDGPMTGISRKLPDTERSRLKSILKRIVPEDAGVIIRTAAEGASEEDLTADVERLQAQWQTISSKAESLSSKAPVLLHGEPDLAIKTVRDLFNEDISEMVIDGPGAFEEISAYVSDVAPDLLPRVHKWDGVGELFAAYRVQEGLAKALERKVHLPSGGSLVIDRTEALVAIDVNTGRFTGVGGSNLEETVTRNNLEAAEEIARQLRLRDIGGMVIVDFIDMVLESNRDLVLRRLIECLGRDRTKHQVSEVTSLGLVQLTRKRVGQGLLESFSETCPTCGGRGVLVHPEGYDPNTPKPASRPAVPSPAAVAAKVAESHRAASSGTPADSVAELAVAEGDAVTADPGDSSIPADTDAADPGSGGPGSGGPGSGGRRRRGGRRPAVRDVTSADDAADVPETPDAVAASTETPDASVEAADLPDVPAETVADGPADIDAEADANADVTAVDADADVSADADVVAEAPDAPSEAPTDAPELESEAEEVVGDAGEEPTFPGQD